VFANTKNIIVRLLYPLYQVSTIQDQDSKDNNLLFVVYFALLPSQVGEILQSKTEIPTCRDDWPPYGYCDTEFQDITTIKRSEYICRLLEYHYLDSLNFVYNDVTIDVY